MAGRPVSLHPLSEKERIVLELWIKNGLPHEVLRARIILFRSQMSQGSTAQKLGISKRSVSKWTVRYGEKGIDGLADRLGRGRKRTESSASDRNRLAQQKKKVSARSEAKRGAEDERCPPSQEATQPIPRATFPTMRMVADEAKVSLMTVSRVMRNQPHVQPALANRVWAAARRIGYRRDPRMSKLMAHLRNRRTVGLQGIICGLEAESWISHPQAYFEPMVKAARVRADDLGFAWETFSFERFMENPEHSLKVLYHRGVDGILLLPLPPGMRQCGLPESTYWQHFSTMVATYAIDAPDFRRVVPDHFKNIKLMCERLSSFGCRRIGLAIPRQFDDRVLNHYSGGYASFHMFENRVMPKPFMYLSPEERRKNIGAWYLREKPDAIIVGSSEVAAEMMNDLKYSQIDQVCFATISLPDEELNGIDELPGRIGSVAVELLSGMIVHNEKGIPESPLVTMVPGVWKSGRKRE